jgi:predicted DNA-binding transcriptional regulator AlpA
MPKKSSELRPQLVSNISLTEGRRLLSRAEVLDFLGISGPTLWMWMREGKFPRSRTLYGRSVWFSDEVEAFLNALPVTKLKGDADA